MGAFSKFLGYSEEASKCIEKNFPGVLTGIGIIGMGITMLFVYDATKSGVRILDEKKEDMAFDILENDVEEGTKEFKEIQTYHYREAAKDIIPLCIPAAVTFIGSSVCLIKSCSINTKRVAALATSYTLLENAYKEYREKVIEKVGEKKEEKIRDQIFADRVKDNQVPEGMVCLDGEVIFYDKYRDGYFTARPDDVLNAIAEVNNSIFNNGLGFASVQDLYLEIDPRLSDRAPKDIGWNTNNPLQIRVSYQVLPNMSSGWCLDYMNEPRANYDRWR